MSYEELQTAIVQDSHREDLAGLDGEPNLIPRFIREGEDMIRRELTAYIQDSDRIMQVPSQQDETRRWR